jgi:hypothetical protein
MMSGAPMPPPMPVFAAGAPNLQYPHHQHVHQFGADAAAAASAASSKAAASSDDGDKKKPHLRKAAGKIWEDDTLDDWPESMICH